MDVVNYDADLQMFIDEPHSINLDALSFVRWLVETGRLVDDTLPVWED